MKENAFHFGEKESVDEEGFRSAFTYVPEQPTAGSLTRRHIIAGASVLVLVCAGLFGGGIYLGKGLASAKSETVAPKKLIAAQTAVQHSAKATTVPEKQLQDVSASAAKIRAALKTPTPEDTPGFATVNPPAIPVVSKTSAATQNAKTKEAHAEKEKQKAAPDPNRKGYAVQVAAFRVKTKTLGLAKKLREKGYTVYVSVTGNGRWHRVRIGNYTRRPAAIAVKNRLRKRGYRPMVIRVG